MKVINLYGGPCSGKSSIMAGLFYELKKNGKNVEMSPEFVKDCVYDENPYPFKDQIYVFANMLKRLRQYDGKVDYVITDAPLLMNCIYGSKESDTFFKLVHEEYNKYDNYEYILKNNSEYIDNGRVHTKKEAKNIQEKVEAMFHECGLNPPILSIQKDDPVNYIIDDITDKEYGTKIYCLGFSFDSNKKNVQDYFDNFELTSGVSKENFKNSGFITYPSGAFGYYERLRNDDNYPESISIILNKKRDKIDHIDILDESFLQPTYITKESFKQIENIMNKLVDKHILRRKEGV